MKKQICGIYIIQNQKNNKLYIGSSKDISKRFQNHLSNLKNNNHKNKHLQQAVNKYGLSSFKFFIMEECLESELIEKEQFYIDIYQWENLYNKTKIAYGGGSDAVEIPLYLLDLKGNIINEYKSGAELARFLQKRNIVYSTVNTDAISKKQYRIVTQDFYKTNLEEILKWRTYSNETEYKKQLQLIPKYKIITNDNTYLLFTLDEIAEMIGTSRERARQLIGRRHKKTGYLILLNN